MKKIYSEPKLILSSAGTDLSLMQVITISNTPSDPDEEVLGKDRDDFSIEEEGGVTMGQEGQDNSKSLW